jgi:general secretion pathway protein K
LRRLAGAAKAARALLAGTRRSQGFALLIVLWMLVLIGLIVTQLTARGRTELRIAYNLSANAAAEAAADGAINEAVFRLSDPQPERAWQADGSRRELTIGHSRIGLRIDNEAAHINPSLASPALLEGLLRAIGSDAETAKQLSRAIAEWVGRPVAGRSHATVAAEYRASGRDYGPPGAPLESLDELARVRGMTPAILDALRPYLTLYGPAVPDPQAADPAVAAALDFVGGQRGDLSQTAAIAARRGGFVTARITATAHGPGNAEFTRVAVVRLSPGTPQRPVWLAWGPSLE